MADAFKPLPFLEAIAWARDRQVVLPDVYYGELQGLARSMAFSVAGLAKLDQLQSVMDSLTDATANGESFAAWKKRASTQDMGLPAHRVENIFRTNIQGHYGRGRCEQQKRNTETRPWYLYDAVNDSRTRPSHAAMDGLVARHDDPIWQDWTPPAGYQCRCRRIALSERQAQRYIDADAKRMQDPERATARVTAAPDAGWDYDPCSEPTEGLRRAIERRLSECADAQLSRRRGKRIACQPEVADDLRMRVNIHAAAGKLPKPRRLSGIERLPPQLSEQGLFERFMREFGGENDVLFSDVINNSLKIGKELFLKNDGKWKIQKGERAQWLLYTAHGIKWPDEIRHEPGKVGGRDRLYYLSRFDVGRRGILSCIAVFDRAVDSAGAWYGRTNYATTRDDGYLETKRKIGDVRYVRADGWER